MHKRFSDEPETTGTGETYMQIDTCPHCGGMAFLTQTYSYKCRCYFVAVKCDICGASGKPYTQKDPPSDDKWQSMACSDAIRAWNMRTPSRDRDPERMNEYGQQSDRSQTSLPEEMARPEQGQTTSLSQTVAKPES